MDRLIIEKTEPKGIQALYDLQNYLNDTQLTSTEEELIKIRASQINGCAYCVNMHSRQALKNGQSQQKLNLICVWKEAGNAFTEAERVLLKLTEEVTLIHRQGLSDDNYQQATALFGEVKTAQALMAVIIINSWNRLTVSLQTRL